MEDKNMIFIECLKEQCRLHPAMQPQDVVKLAFQAAFGAEHLLTDVEAAQTYFAGEFEQVEAAEVPLCERISQRVYRVNLAAWKMRGLPAQWLFRMFAASAGVCRCEDGGREQFLSYLATAGEVLFGESAGEIVGCEIANREIPGLSFAKAEWQQYLAEYLQKEPEAVHHSDLYRAQERPAYRVVAADYIRLLPILEAISKVQAEPVVIAIDGRAAAGKSTLAGLLQQILQGTVIRMDDFFLPMELRTEERFAVPGSNVHYERFLEEVLPNLREKKSFSYRKFDCSCMKFNGEVQVEAEAYRIVEGSYSCHPKFGAYADVTVFCNVDSDEQIRRIIKRNGTHMAEMFRTRWIPLEEAYFEAFQIKEKALILNQS